jgi:glycine/D-amino acid oxidase-like deaminating enzyme
MCPQAFVPEPQPVPAEAPFVVIGGGLSGVGTCYWLNQRGLPCVLIEGRALGSGASGRNGGVISPTHSTALSRSFHEENISHLVGVMHAEGLDCEYRVGGYLSLAYEGTEDAKNVGPHKEDDTTDYWNAAKVKAALGGAESFQFGADTRKIAGGMFKNDAGQVWPAKLVQTLAKACDQTTFCTHTVALALRRAQVEGRIAVETDKGTVVTDKVCICTNGWAPRLLPALAATGILYPLRQNVVMTGPAKTWDWAGSVSSSFTEPGGGVPPNNSASAGSFEYMYVPDRAYPYVPMCSAPLGIANLT